MVYKNTLPSLDDILESVKKIEIEAVYQVHTLRYKRDAAGDCIENPNDPIFGYELERDAQGDVIIDSGVAFLHSGGSGSVVYNDGKEVYILTNNHVVEANSFERYLRDKSGVPTRLIEEMYTPFKTTVTVEGYEFEIVATDDENDIAVIRSTDAQAIAHFATVGPEFGSHDDLQIGTHIYAAGHPYGLELLITDGIITGLHSDTHINMNVPINHGNSGGPLYAIKIEDGKESLELIGIAQSTFAAQHLVMTPISATGEPNDTADLGAKPLEVPAQGITHGVSIHAITDFLKENNLEYIVTHAS